MRHFFNDENWLGKRRFELPDLLVVDFGVAVGSGSAAPFSWPIWNLFSPGERHQGHITQSFVVATVVIVIDEIVDGLLQVKGHLIRYLIHLLLDTLMVPLQLPIALGMEGRSQDVMDSY
jgi:hypothetical protein